MNIRYDGDVFAVEMDDAGDWKSENFEVRDAMNSIIPHDDDWGPSKGDQRQSRFSDAIALLKPTAFRFGPRGGDLTGEIN